MGTEEDKITHIEYELVEAFLNRDIKTLERILADEFIITDPHGPSFTKEQYLADLAADRVSFKSLVIDEMEVRVMEGTAVVMGKATAHGHALGSVYISG
jgi:hypothetical protein